MKKIRIISALLTLALMIGSFSFMFTYIEVEAKTEPKIDEEGLPVIDYITKVYASPEEKLEEMTLMKEQNGYQIWIEEFTLEVAVVNLTTGDIMFTNPYDVAGDTGSESTKQKLLSQIHIKYTDNDQDKDMYSYVETALRSQGVIKNIKNGIRVEYTIGREETRMLVPRLIEAEHFNNDILANIDDEWWFEKLSSYYTLKDPEADSLTERGVKAMKAKFPITEKMAVYVCDPDIKERELKQCEWIIKTYVPSYTYEMLDEDHALTEYEGMDRAPALFRMALEYTLDDYGLTVRLPANGISYDESNYQLQYVQILQYMGTTSNAYTGYTFIPDGSGAILRSEDLIGNTYTVTGKVYGADYAYHEISGQHIEVMRLPVYGIVENYNRTDSVSEEVLVTEAYFDEATQTEVPAVYETVTTKTPVEYNRGFLAIITEGDALAEITSEHGGTLHRYNSVFATFYPRPSDTYNLADSISIGSNATWTVESKRKYVDSYRIRYIMLTDDAKAADAGLSESEYYSTDVPGMARAYSDYLTRTGILSRISDDSVKSDIPLYIETFGTIETTDRFLSIPVTVDTPLTTFEDIITMHKELSEAGVANINFRMTGFANGGLSNNTYPTFVDWVGAAGGNSGFNDLISYATANGVGIFPDFDFAYMEEQELFDGFVLKRDAVKTIDDRYSRRRYYDAATQSFDSSFALCVSPSAYERLYTNFASDYKAYNPLGISVSTLGSDLNSDFDEDEPYNREDSKAFTISLMQQLKEDYGNVMIDGGNAFTYANVTDIVNMSLDSSRFLNASNSVPFMGMVLHGFVRTAGTPINMEGDVDYMLLKAIENGAYLYFTLSYRNTSELKDSFMLSKYYSVRYDIWFDELVEKYAILNGAMADLQTKLITDHEFLIGERVPDPDEVEADAAAAALALAEEEKAAADELEKEERAKQLAIRLGEAVEEEIVEEPAEDEEAVVAEETEAVEEETEYVVTKYTSDDGSIVRVEYEGGINFILNYNSFDVTVVYNNTTYTIPALGFERIG